MRLTESFKKMLIETAKALKDSARRLFMARTAKELGPGGQQSAARELGWSRMTIRKGMRELESGITCIDAFRLRGRKRAEEHLPNLLTDIKAIADSQSQTDPQFRNNRLYTRLSAAEVRRQLIAQKNYTDAELPKAETISKRLNDLGYYPRKVAKSRPKKKIPATDAIFEEVKQVNHAADEDDTVLRVSMDAKATVKVGDFSRGGKSRIPTQASDHDFKPEATITPVGLLMPKTGELFLYGITSKVTSDCLVDCLENWWISVNSRYTNVRTLVINLDNGPENHSRRTQFMQRIVLFAQKTGLTIRLAYYPPYHSKYNPIERCWGILENHWNGALLDSIDTVIRFAQTMTWKGIHPVVKLVSTTYKTGVRLTKAAMQEVEAQIKRSPQLGKWFVDINPRPVTQLSG